MGMADSDFLYAGASPSDDDKRLFVTFTMEARLDNQKTTEEGRNIYRNVEFITLRIPGDKTLSIHRPVRPSDKHRFPIQYAAFKNLQGEVVVGTPLRLWPGASPAQVKELEYFNVQTVEQLAAMPDGSSGANMMGIQALRAAARQYVQLSKEQAPLLKVQKELEERDNKIAALEDLIAKQGATLDKILSREEAVEKVAKKGK
jgi:hypothetical protein